MGEKKNQQSGGHKALYRKYRSKSLDEIVGQEHITKTLKNAVKQGRVSHAYLFTGPRGTGKTSIARILAHELNNLPYEDESTHLDIIEIDAASNRRIDDIRDLRDKVHIAPLSAKYKVYIIDEVHMLTPESFNALLKTLEEPPEHVIFILATTEVHKLPATIISRTQRHSFRFIPHAQVTAHLKTIAQNEGITITDDALQLIAQHGGGSFRDSISLLDQMSGSESTVDAEVVELLLGLAPKETLEKLLAAAQEGQNAQILTHIETLLQSGLTPSAIAMQLLTLIRSTVRSNEHSARALGLMKDLLTVQSAQYPQLMLETILLSSTPQAAVEVKQSAPEQAPQAPAPRPAAPAKAQPPSKSKGELKEIEPQKPQEDTQITNVKEAPAKATPKTATSSEATFSPEEHWPKVLEAIKKKNNSLYTVLRLATPVIEAGELLLIFGFPFHKKKLEEAKYKSILAEVLTEISGEATFSTVVDKSRSKPTPSSVSAPAAAEPDPAHASLISNIQDIMGGGEVVNV